MRAGRLRRTRSRTSKPKRGSKKRYKSLRAMTDYEETTQVAPAHSLLLSSLKFWEVERDLIEERISAIGR
jgi:hypothetical protein